MRARPADFRIELGYLRDNLLAAIQSKRTSALHEGLEIYENLVSSFIDKLQEWGSPYDKKRAMQEVTSIGGDWSEIKWINDDLHELIDAGIAAQNHHIMHEVFLLLYKLARNALTGRDYYIFYRSVIWFPYIFQASASLPAGMVREYLVKHSLMGLTEIANLFVFPELELCESPEDLDRILDFAQGMVVVFSQLLRNAYSNGDDEHFNEFAQDLAQLFLGSSIGQRSADRHAALTVARLNHHLSVQEEATIEKETKLARRRMDIVSELAQYKDLASFGIGAILLRDYEADKLSAEKFNQYYRSLPKTFSLEEAWRLYVRAADDDVKKDFGWEWWDLTGAARGAGFWSEIDQDLQLNFVIRSLEVIAGTRDDYRAVLSIPGSPELPPLAQDENSPLKQLLSQLEQNAEKWRQVFGNSVLSAIPVLRAVLSAAVSSEKRKQAEALVNANLSGKKVDRFGQNVLKGWRESALIRELVKEAKMFASGLAAPEDTPSFGLNRRERKAIFAEGTPDVFDRMGEEYGGSIGRGEDEIVLDKLAKTARPLTVDPIAQTEIFNFLDNGLAELRRDGYDPAILALNFWQIEMLLEGRTGFAPRRVGMGEFWRLGKYDGAPVCQFRYSGPAQLLCVDFKRIGKWLQFLPTPTADDEAVLEEQFLFSVRPITHAQARDLLEKFPELRQGKPGENRPEEGLVGELQQQVHLRVVEQFDYQIVDSNAAIAIRFA